MQQRPVWTAITIFNGVFCDAELVAKTVSDITGYRTVTDQDIIADAAGFSGLPEEEIAAHLSSEASGSEDGPKREHVISWLRLAMARKLSGKENLLFFGHIALLPPTGIDNILKVCLVSGMSNRVRTAAREMGCSEQEARQFIRQDDRKRADWTIAVTDCNDPWADPLYDVIIPVDSIGAKGSAAFVAQQAAHTAVADSECSLRKIKEFLLASTVQAELARKGHDVTVSARRNSLSLCINNHASILKSATRKLLNFVSGFDGVKDVEVGTGCRYSQTDVFDRARRPRTAMPRTAPSRNTCDVADASQTDMDLAASIQEALLGQGRDISVFVKNGSVSLTINSHKVMLQTMAQSLSEFVSGFEGVSGVEIGIGRDYHELAPRTSIRQSIAKALLTDDREFAMNLSSRLAG